MLLSSIQLEYNAIDSQNGETSASYLARIITTV